MLSDARIVSTTMKSRQTKQCTRCSEHLPIEMFYVNKRSLFGRQGMCKMCKKETRVMPTLEQNRRWRDNGVFSGKREIVLKRDGFCCVVCGVSNAEHMKKYKRNIGVHHKDGNGVNSKTKNNSISNLETLCVACHTRKHNIESGRRPISKWNKLSREDCLEIVKTPIAYGTISSLSRKFGVSRQAIMFVYEGKIHHNDGDE
jgi:hypothetical protein